MLCYIKTGHVGSVHFFGADLQNPKKYDCNSNLNLEVMWIIDGFKLRQHHDLLASI